MRRFAPLTLSLSALSRMALPRTALLHAALSLATLGLGAAPVLAAPTLSPAAAATEAAHDAAMEGYLYFYPLVTMDLTRRQFTHPSQGAQGAPANAFLHQRALPRPGAATPWANPVSYTHLRAHET